MTDPQPPDDNVIRFQPRTELPQPPKHKHPPMFDIPPATKILTGLLLGIHATIWVLTHTVFPNAEAIAIAIGAFIPGQWTGEVEFFWWTPFSILLFSFLHAGWLHIGVNTVMLLAIGAGLEKRTTIKTFLFIYIGSTLCAVIAHFALAPFSTMPIIGASGGVSGLFGATLYMMRSPADSHSRSLIPPSVLPVVLVWVGITAITGFIGAPNGSPVAWIAHIGGFISGIGLMTLVSKRQQRH